MNSIEYNTLCPIKTICRYFGGTPQNINRTYRKKKPIAFDVIDIGSFVIDKGISKQELEKIISIWMSK